MDGRAPGVGVEPRGGAPTDQLGPVWLPAAGSSDVHAAFRAHWSSPLGGAVQVQALAASRFRLWVDGALVGDGPVRFPVAHPRCQRWRLDLAAGPHVLSVHVHAFGVPTRMLADLPGFVWARVLDADEQPAALRWRCRRLDSYTQTGLRVSPLFGPLEWAHAADTGWADRDCADRDWADRDWLEPAPAQIALGPIGELPLERPADVGVPAALLDAGQFADRFTGYEFDDPAIQFVLADLAAADDPDGRWARFDLGRTRLGTAQVTVDSPDGGDVVIAGAAELTGGRVAPVVALSTGPTAFLSRFRVPPGRHTVEPLSPAGVRFVETRGYGRDLQISSLRYRSHERLGEPLGSLATGDDLLDTIWRTGVETLRACADDVLVDTPTRERGQWLGDISACGLEVSAVAYGRVDHAARSLLMAADCVDGDGLVPGLFPGQGARVSTFAAQWVSACRRHVELTGDLTLLDQVYPVADSTLAVLTACVGADGATSELPWSFVDWGYLPAGVDLATLLIIRRALDDHLHAGMLLNRADTGRWSAELHRFTRLVAEHWGAAGFHATALALRDGVLGAVGAAAGDVTAAANLLTAHLQGCFPYDSSGFRQRDPAAVSARLATPYFANVSLDALLRAGRTEFVLEQWRRCWGWMLSQGATTWWEVFDSRWSHCHLWSAGPTWQLTRHLLGWWPRFDLGAGQVELRPAAGARGLPDVRGRVPLPDGQIVDVCCRRADFETTYTIDSPVPLILHRPAGGSTAIGPGRSQVRVD